LPRTGDEAIIGWVARHDGLVSFDAGMESDEHSWHLFSNVSGGATISEHLGHVVQVTPKALPGELAKFVRPGHACSRFFAVVSCLLRSAQSLLEMGISKDVREEGSKGRDGDFVGELNEALKVDSASSRRFFELADTVLDDWLCVGFVFDGLEFVGEVVDVHERVVAGCSRRVVLFAFGDEVIEGRVKELCKAVVACAHSWIVNE